MSTTGNPTSQPSSGQLDHELATLRHEWWWFLILGIALIVMGAIALGSSFFVSVVTVVLFGVLLMMGGIAQIVSAFWAGKWSGVLLHVLVGILYIVVGLIMADTPVESALALTLLMAAFFIVGGTVRIVAALFLRFHNWGWPLLNGFITLMLGVLIYKNWPASGLMVIGMFVGIEMIFNGWTWVMLSLNVRSLLQGERGQPG